MSLPTPRAITLDAGGTLVRPSPSVGVIYAEVMTRHGMAVDAEELEAGFGRAWKLAHRYKAADVSEAGDHEWWRRIVRDTIADLDPPADFDALFNELWTTFADPHRWELFDGAIEVMDQLAAGGYRLAILSNWDSRLHTVLNGLGLAARVERVIISAEVGFEKPDARIFRHAEKLLGCREEELLHIGDSLHHDHRGARDAGWQAILVSNERYHGSDIRRAESLREIPDLVRG